MDCKHPKMTKVENSENGGVDSQIYQCDECKELLRVALSSAAVTVSYGKPTIR